MTLKRKKGLLKASKTQLHKLGIFDVPTGALVELYEIDQYETPFGLGSKMRYKYENLDYIIPTEWVA